MEEGECWEAFMFASHYGLSNLRVMLDRNHLQIGGTTAVSYTHLDVYKRQGCRAAWPAMWCRTTPALR